MTLPLSNNKLFVQCHKNMIFIGSGGGYDFYVINENDKIYYFGDNTSMWYSYSIGRILSDRIWFGEYFWAAAKKAQKLQILK
jgi:hypothetical protein